MPLKLTRRKGSAVWYITGTIAGQRIRESLDTAKREIAEEALNHRERQLRRAAIYGPEIVKTWADAVLRYEETRAPAPGQAALLTRLTTHFGPNTLLKDIDQDRVDAAVRALCASDAAPATKLRNVISPIRAVLTVAARRGWCKPPSFEVPDGATGQKRTRWLTPAEFVALRDEAAPHLRPLIVFLACTGARLGEALALDWIDVDLPHGRAWLRDVKSKPGEQRDRLLELPPAAIAAMAAMTYPALDPRDRLVKDEEGRRVMVASREGRVFRTDEGRAYPDSEDGGGQVRSAWATACRRAGFAGSWQGDERGKRRWTPADVTPHVLRHTWASWRYAFHRDILRLKDEGDWSSVSLCERYAKLVPEGMLPGIYEAWGLPPAGTQLAQSKRGIA